MRIQKIAAIGVCLGLLGLGFLFSQVRVMQWDQVKNNEAVIVKAIDDLLKQNDQLRGQIMAFMEFPVSSMPGSAFHYVGSRLMGGGKYQYAFKGSNQTAVMFENFNYGGKQFGAEIGASVADLDDLGNSKGMNDKVSSVKVVFGGMLVLYEDKNFRGRSVSFTEDTANLGDFNDKMSSYKMEGRILVRDMLWTMLRDRLESELKQHLNAK